MYWFELETRLLNTDDSCDSVSPEPISWGKLMHVGMLSEICNAVPVSGLISFDWRIT